MMSAGDSPAPGGVGSRVCAQATVLVGDVEVAGAVECQESGASEVVNQTLAIINVYEKGKGLGTKFEGSAIRVSLMTQEQAVAYLKAEQARIDAQAKAESRTARVMYDSGSIFQQGREGRICQW